jgi:hypothetical protein
VQPLTISIARIEFLGQSALFPHRNGQNLACNTRADGGLSSELNPVPELAAGVRFPVSELVGRSAHSGRADCNYRCVNLATGPRASAGREHGADQAHGAKHSTPKASVSQGNACPPAACCHWRAHAAPFCCRETARSEAPAQRLEHAKAD